LLALLGPGAAIESFVHLAKIRDLDPGKVFSGRRLGEAGSTKTQNKNERESDTQKHTFIPS
jgi:hypothetical protein